MASQEDISSLRDDYLNNANFLGYGVTKKRIVEAHQARFGQAHQRYLELINPDNHEIDEILKVGGIKARLQARKTINQCRSIVGLD